ncbi:hypothetical protein [Streptomyces sp. NPDC051180]|uniref:hypothetical protein n=1 Tax=unclassified Streptomyces TaxID=2593676 RepID=UPI003450684B
MGDFDAKDPIIKPQDLHATGGGEQIVTKDLHATSEPANAIADKILTREQKPPVATTDDLHATSEPAN